MTPSEKEFEETRRLGRTVDDLVGLTTLSSEWIELGAAEFADSLATALLTTLSLELVYICLPDRTVDDDVVEALCSRPLPGSDGVSLETVKTSLAPLLVTPGRESTTTVPDWLGSGALQVAVNRFGVTHDSGLLFTGSRNVGFPGRRERALLSVGGNLAAMVVQRQRVEDRVRQSDAGKIAILETALDCIITMDHEGRVVEFNPAAETTFGYRRAEVVGRQLVDLIVPEALRERHQRGMERYLATGEATVLGRRLEISALHADGTEFPVELAITRIPTDGPPLFTAYLRDISDRAREESHRSAAKGCQGAPG